MTLASLTKAGKRPYPPRVSETTKPFWDGLADNRFIATECTACSKVTFPPRAFCAHCWSRSVRHKEIFPVGTLYTHTLIHVAPATFAHEAPYRACVIDLDVGLRIAMRLLSDTTPEIGSRVEIVAVHYDDGPLFAARPIV